MADEQRALQRQGELLDDAAGSGLDLVEVGELGVGPGDEVVEAGVRAGRGLDLGEEGLQRLR